MTRTGKLKKLRGILRALRPAMVAFSGGVDSSFLLAVAADTLKNGVCAVTLDTPAFARSELRQAKRIAASFGVRHEVAVVRLPSEFWRNAPRRCYFCKKRLFAQLKRIARARSAAAVIDASHADDTRDYRPGAQALAELGIRSPLREAGLTKEDIRALSRAMGLAAWNRPSLACLASRIPYGERITVQRLAVIERAEEALRTMGIRSARVRAHGPAARIEVAQKEIPLVVRLRERIAAALKKQGFTYVSLDLEGYRSGSMNEVLRWKKNR